MPNRIMAHLVAGYPDEESSREVARALCDSGASYLELQFPFSEPTADGPLIQDACARALEKGFTLARGIALLERMRAASPVPVFVMSYANMAFRAGVASFVQRCRDAGACGLIVPDLSPGADEGLYAAGAAAGIAVAPVVVPTMSGLRLREVLAARPEYLYAALRAGITGQTTEVGEETLEFLRRIGAGGAAPKVLAGFGIQAKRQADLLAPHVHAVVVGSALVRVIGEAGGSVDGAGGGVRVHPLYQAVRKKLESLL